jgi:hypothetical protein
VSVFVALDEGTFCHRARVLARAGALRRSMALEGRRQAWDRTFHKVYEGYSKLLQPVR